jgi:hypothetical protein
MSTTMRIPNFFNHGCESCLHFRKCSPKGRRPKFGSAVGICLLRETYVYSTQLPPCYGLHYEEDAGGLRPFK